MLFALGYIAGLVTAALVIATVTYLRVPLERRLDAATKAIMLSGPRPQGFIIEPEDEATEIRRDHIRRNAEQGKDTPISELKDAD